MSNNVNSNPSNYTSSNITPEVYNSHTNTLRYVISSMLKQLNTFLPCEVLADEGNQRYTIQSLVNFLDVTGNPITPPAISDVPVMQIGGGNAGIVTQLQVGDVVWVGFCQRNLVNVKQNWTQQNPANLRYCDLADAIIMGILTNTAPEIYVTITNNGIGIVSPNNNVTINCQNATVEVNSSDIVLGGSGAVGVLNADTIITAPPGGGTCTITQESTTVKCTS